MVEQSSSSDKIEELKTNSVIKSPSAPATGNILPFLVSPSQVSQQGGTKELIMHCLMYGTSLYSELQEYREYTVTNTHKVAFSSSAFSQVQLFMEFLFEVINERDEPLVFAFEAVKFCLRLREYRSLVRHERINVLIDMEIYKQFKLAQEHEEGVCSLIRSQKQIEKPPESTKVLSSGLQRLRQKAVKKKSQSVTFQESANGESNSLELASDSYNKKKPSRGIFFLIKELFKLFGNLLLNSRFCIDELINIARPVIYLYSILRFGRRSFKPLKISLTLDIVQIFFSCLRLLRSNREKKKLSELDSHSKHRPQIQPLVHMATSGKQGPEIEISSATPDKKLHFLLRNIEVSEITRRCYAALLKYLVRDPIFTVYTKPFIVSLLRKVRIPHTIIAYFFAYINYYRYYTYIS